MIYYPKLKLYDNVSAVNALTGSSHH